MKSAKMNVDLSDVDDDLIGLSGFESKEKELPSNGDRDYQTFTATGLLN